MPNTEHDPYDRGFEWRLKAALDRVTPPSSSPRYASTVMGGARAWSLGPALVAAGATMLLLAVSATAATGSANPVVWAERAGTTIQSVGHTPEAAPSSEPGSEPAPTTTAARAHPTQDTEQEAAESPEPNKTPGPGERPERSEAPEPADREVPEPAKDFKDHSS
jgi:hypothetical protein